MSNLTDNLTILNTMLKNTIDDKYYQLNPNKKRGIFGKIDELSPDAIKQIGGKFIKQIFNNLKIKNSSEVIDDECGISLVVDDDETVICLDDSNETVICLDDSNGTKIKIQTVNVFSDFFSNVANAICDNNGLRGLGLNITFGNDSIKKSKFSGDAFRFKSDGLYDYASNAKFDYIIFLGITTNAAYFKIMPEKILSKILSGKAILNDKSETKAPKAIISEPHGDREFDLPPLEPIENLVVRITNIFTNIIA